MDGAHFDRLSRLVTPLATRRTALGLVAAPLLGAGQPAQGKKKRKPRCQHCGPCQQCDRRSRKRRCVAQGSDIACADGAGVCVAGTCCLPGTCASLGVTCGTVPDGCGRELSCGTCGAGPTPACNSGTCATCAATCAASCPLCYHGLDGLTACGNPDTGTCTIDCATSADCPAAFPFCAASITVRTTNVTQTASTVCGGPPRRGYCVRFNPC